jgi:hypothetical protein
MPPPQSALGRDDMVGVSRRFKVEWFCVCVLAVLTTTGCYPDYIHTPSPAFFGGTGVPPNVVQAINKSLQDCSDQYDAARQSAYKMHKAQYQAGVFGSGVTMVTGGGAGALGAASQQTASAITGGASLASGIVTLVLVNPSGIKSAEDQQAKVAAAWDKMRDAKAAYEEAVLNNASDQNAKLVAFVGTVGQCGLQPPPAFFSQ